jgi:crotonobetainyl-CoA:carnitine CoA-transferase CaiB-like acyl-CoA transferase
MNQGEEECPMQNALEGLRVIELGQVLAGPFAGAILADLGAEVVKVERAEGGDDSRKMGPAFRRGDALSFHIFNRGKKSVVLDLKTREGLAGFEQLVAQADVLIHNLRPGVTDDLGIDAATVSQRYPKLIYCEISAFGHLGPMRMQPGYEPLVQAFSGLSSTNGGPDDPPMRTGASVCDQGTGMWAVIALLALLQRRQVTGRGGIVNTSLLETALVWAGQKADAWVNEQQLPQRHRSGHPGFVPYEEFATQTGPLLVCCGNDRLFGKLAQVLQQPAWVADPRYATNRDRLSHKSELLDAIASLLKGQTREHWIELFNRAGVPCSPVHTLPEALAHPQVSALSLLQPVPGEDFVLTALPFSIDGRRPTVTRVAPALGEHNDALGIHMPISTEL